VDAPPTLVAGSQQPMNVVTKVDQVIVKVSNEKRRVVALPAATAIFIVSLVDAKVR